MRCDQSNLQRFQESSSYLSTCREFCFQLSYRFGFAQDYHTTKRNALCRNCWVNMNIIRNKYNQLSIMWLLKVFQVRSNFHQAWLVCNIWNIRIYTQHSKGNQSPDSMCYFYMQLQLKKFEIQSLREV